MASDPRPECLIECVVGIKELIQSPNKEPLEERLEKDGVKQSIREKMEKNYNSRSGNQKNVSVPNPEQEHIRDIYVIGQDIAVESVKELSRTLLERDYLNLANFDGSSDVDVGVIVIPEKHIPKKPRIVDPENSRVVLENNPTYKKLQVSLFIAFMY